MAIYDMTAIIEDISLGKMVILMDDENRENEGDIVMAAECVTPQHVNFMSRNACGLICLTLTAERCDELELPMMVENSTDPHGTGFTISIEAAEGTTTGISAHDRAQTIQTAVRKGAKPLDLTRPGHIFPLRARDGGVLVREGHTEAGCDLAGLAGFEPAAVIVEIMNEDGTMARRPELEVYAEKHGLKLGLISDLVQYRKATEIALECA